MDQITPYWDGSQLSVGSTVAGSVESFAAIQATGASATIPMGIATRPGIIKDARLASITPMTGNDTLSVNIMKNGVSILAGGTPQPLGIIAARVSVLATLAATNAPVNPGDLFEAVFSYTHGTGTAPLNVIAQVQLVEN